MIEVGRFFRHCAHLGVLVLASPAWANVAEDRPPIVVAPDTMTIRASLMMQFDVTAHDPDGEDILAFVAEGIPGANFVRSTNNTSGWLSWTPGAIDVGSHLVTFSASNSLVGSATTVIEVLPPPIPPVATFTASPNAGLAPLEVTLDASGSRDPDGTIVRYRFAFGDGTAVEQTSPIATHVYAGGVVARGIYIPGYYNASVRVWDDHGAFDDSYTIQIRSDRPPVAAFTASGGKAPITVGFYAHSSYDPEGADLVRYDWDFGDGTREITPYQATQHLYREGGTWTVRLTVTDVEGHTGTTSGVVVVAPPDRPPIVTAQGFVVAKAGDPLVIPVSAYDPDGETIQAITTVGAPTASSMTFSPDDASAVFTWIPTAADVGTRGFYFNAVSSGGAYWFPVVVSVWSPELPPNLGTNPSFDSNMNGWTSYAGATLERVEGGHSGGFGLRVTGPAVVDGSFGVNDSPDVIHSTLIAGLCYRYTAWVRSATSRGVARLRIREYAGNGAKLGEATSSGVSLSPEWQMLTLDYTTKSGGSTLDFQVRDYPVTPSEVFEVDDIGVRNVTGHPGTGVVGVPQERDDIALRARITPSPVRSSGTLSFTTSRRGALRVELLDLAGRRVRRLLDQSDAAAGSFRLPITPSASDGESLGPGVYFYRVESAGAVITGRFVLLL